MRARHGVLPDVHEGEGARPVRALGVPDLEARLAEEGGLLVPRHARDGDAVRQEGDAARHADALGVAHDARQDRAGTRKSSSIAGSHSAVARFISRVRDAFVTSVTWSCAARQSRWTRKLSMVPKASSPFSARARAPSTWSSSQAALVPEKYGVEQEPGRRAHRLVPGGLQLAHVSAVRRSLPDDGVVDGAPGRALPDDGRLALVR